MVVLWCADLEAEGRHLAAAWEELAELVETLAKRAVPPRAPAVLLGSARADPRSTASASAQSFGSIWKAPAEISQRFAPTAAKGRVGSAASLAAFASQEAAAAAAH